MKLSRYEQETIVNYNNEGKTAEIYTCDPFVMKKLDALVDAYPNCYRLIKETKESRTYSCPKKMITFRKPVIITEERKAKAIAQLNKIRERREISN